MTMDTLLGGLAFAALILAQFAAVIAVRREYTSSRADAPAPPHGDHRATDHRANLIWQSGD